MEQELKLYKYFTLDENIRYPECWECSKELSPYIAEEAPDEFLNGCIEAGVVLGFKEGKPIIMLCKKCCEIGGVE